MLKRVKAMLVFGAPQEADSFAERRNPLGKAAARIQELVQRVRALECSLDLAWSMLGGGWELADQLETAAASLSFMSQLLGSM